MAMSTEPVEELIRLAKPGAIHTEDVLILDLPLGSLTIHGLIKLVPTMVKLLSIKKLIKLI